MPQVDLETLVSVCGGDRKIACETLAAADPLPPGNHPDSPPHSFWLSRDAERDWLDQNAFIERKDSAKGSNSHPNSNPNPNPNLNSHGFSLSLKSKASLLGLPQNQKRTFVEAKNRKKCKPVTALLFPKRVGSGRKREGLVEPGSPKVSCMGRVRSKRDKRLRAKESKRLTEPGRTGSGRKQGFFAGFLSIFGCHGKSGVEVGRACVEPLSPPRKSKGYGGKNLRNSPASESDVHRRSVESESEAPSLGGLKRFASGRKSDSWVDADMARS